MPKPRSVELGNPFLTNLEGVCEALLIRHGEQHYFEGMTIAQGVNPPLTELGRRQAAAVGERLAKVELDAVYASPIERAHDTGKAIAGHHDLEAVVVDDLREVDLWGQLDQDQALTDAIDRDELRAIYREAQRTHRWDAYRYGEDFELFRNRVCDAIEALMARHVGERIAIACHGGVIGSYLARLWGTSNDTPVHVHHTSITTVRAMDDHRRVVAVNDFHHVLSFQNELNPLNAN